MNCKARQFLPMTLYVYMVNGHKIIVNPCLVFFTPFGHQIAWLHHRNTGNNETAPLRPILVNHSMVLNALTIKHVKQCNINETYWNMQCPKLHTD